MLGAGIGLTPLLSAHNLVLFAAIVLLNVSFGGGMLGLALFTPVGFLLDPLFDRVGLALLRAPAWPACGPTGTTSRCPPTPTSTTP